MGSSFSIATWMESGVNPANRNLGRRGAASGSVCGSVMWLGSINILQDLGHKEQLIDADSLFFFKLWHSTLNFIHGRLLFYPKKHGGRTPIPRDSSTSRMAFKATAFNISSLGSRKSNASSQLAGPHIAIFYGKFCV